MENLIYIILVYMFCMPSSAIDVAPESLSILPSKGYYKTHLPRPKLNYTIMGEQGAVVVGISYKITGVHDLDLRDMTVLFGTYFRVSWVDPRLVWPSPENLSTDGREELILDPSILSLLWVPDVYVEYSRSIEKYSVLQNVQTVTMDKHKRILVSTMMSVKLSCSWNFIYYPFDIQKCDFVIASYGYTKKDMAMEWLPLGVSAADRIKSELTAYEFQLIPSNGTKCFCESCINDFACGKSTLIFKRRYMAKLLAVYVPSGAMVCVSWLSFFWPPEVIPGRTVLVITSLLTLLSMDFSLRTIMPETGYMKAIDVWMFACIFMVVLALFQYAIIIRIRRLREEIRLSQIKPSASSIQQEMMKLPLQLLNPNKHILNTTEKHTHRYLMLEMWVERISIGLHPIIFICINVFYWSYYLFSQD